MRRLIPLLFSVLTCGVMPSTQPAPDASIVAGAPPITVITVPTVEIVATKLQPRNILILGDSEACAVGYYVRDVAKQVNRENNEPADTVTVDCKTGTTVERWSAGGAFKAALARHPNTDVVVIFLGTNNYWNKAAPDASAITDLIKERELACVWVGNTAVHGKRWPVNGLLRGAVTPTCDYFDTEAAGISLRDGIHPDRAGAIKWIRAVWQVIPPKHEDDCE